MLILVDVAQQRLTLRAGGRVLLDESVSTARKGVGEEWGSERTPRGRHVIRAKIGAGVPVNGVLVGRRFTGEIYRPELRRLYPQRDWILTRILWLSGLERGRNRGGLVDTMRRYVYIHGCPDEDRMGQPGSRGCVKMHNDALLTLFERVEAGTEVRIEAPEHV